MFFVRTIKLKIKFIWFCCYSLLEGERLMYIKKGNINFIEDNLFKSDFYVKYMWKRVSV